MGFVQDIRFALRTLFKNKVVAIVALSSLALIVAGNTVIFSIVNSLLIRPLDFDPEGRLILAWRTERSRPFDRRTVSPADYNDYRTRNRVFEETAAYDGFSSRNLTGSGDPVAVPVAAVTPSFFRVVEVSLAHGRSFTEEEGLPGGDSAAILSHSFFERRFGGDPGILGRSIELDHRSYDVVGVLEEGFEFIESVDVWVPLAIDPASIDRQSEAIWPVIGKLRPGMTKRQAAEDLDAIAADLEQRFPEVNRGIGMEAFTFRDYIPGKDNERFIQIIQAAGIFLLLIACANLASLLLARGQVRQRELALRSAVGASRARVVRQLLTESVALSTIGGLLGIGLGLLGVSVAGKAMAGFLPKLYIPVADYRVISFSLGISVAAGLIFGTIPAFRSTGQALLESLKEGGGRGPASARSWLRRSLVVAQVSLGLVLLFGIGLLLRSFSELQFADPGFNDDRLLTFQLSLPEEDYETPDSRLAFLDQLLPEIQALPGVEGATITSAIPRTYQTLRTGVEVEGQPLAEDEPRPQVTWVAVTPGYFETMSIPLLRGRAFTLADNADAPKVAVIDRRFADRFWPGEPAVGKRIVLRGEERTVVGVAANVMQRRLGELDGPLNAVAYLPWAQETIPVARFMVRSRSQEPTQVADAIRETVWKLDPDLPVDQVMTFKDVVASVFVAFKVFGRLLGGFAVFSLLLAALGVYGVLAYSVSQRTREIGLRVALGASRGRVLGMVLREGIILAVIGFVLGLPVVIGVRAVLESVVEGLAAGWLIFVPLIVAGLFLVILTASFLPARRAANLSPVEALRLE